MSLDMKFDCPLYAEIRSQSCIVSELGSSSSFVNVAWNGLAYLPPSREFPTVREVAALDGLNRVHAAEVVFQKGACSMLILREGKSRTGLA